MQTLYQYIKDKVEMEGKKISENPYILQIKAGKGPLVLYGAGSVGHAVFEYLLEQGIEADFFCSGLNGGYIDDATGKEVLKREDLKRHTNSSVILTIGDTASEKEKEEICNSLCDMGVERERIYRKGWFENKVPYQKMLECFPQIKKVYDMLADEKSKEIYKKRLYYMLEYSTVDFQQKSSMYIDREILNFGNEETIIDAGAWIGDTAELFLNEIGQGCRVYSFEPDEKNYAKLVENMRDRTDVFTENLGVWDSKQELFFAEKGNGSSHVNNERDVREGIRVKTIDLDTYCEKNSIVPTYIKMDIEGAEYKALCGAKKIIAMHRPKLAICIYHSFEDFYTLPLLIKKLNTEYKLYIRHYSDCEVDTIVYAV